MGAIAVLAGCNGDGGGPGNEPFDPEACTLLWYRARTGGVFDLMLVEMPVAEWTSGTKAFDGTTRLGVFYYGMQDSDGDGILEGYQDYAVAGSGNFQITVSGTDEGDDVTFTDGDAQDYFGVGAALIATGGVGNFTGEWSPHEVETGDADPVPSENATMAIAYSGSSLTFGGFVSFGYCWNDSLNASSANRLWRVPSNPP